MSNLVGKKLKDFYVLRRLGRGAMAEVYLAQQLSLGRQVALKVLNSDLARDPSYVRRFHHEARAAAALVHAGIVQIYEVGQDGDVHYIAQEYVPGRNLGELIRSHGTLSATLVLDILRQVSAALSKASSQGIVHRDIKPENIMLAGSGEVKVADFGLARVAGDGGANLTQVGVTMGTPLYMSPEQIEGRDIDSRSDIYSLGITAYHMLLGEPPYTGESPLAVAVQHLNQPAPKIPIDKLSITASPESRNGEKASATSQAVERLVPIIERMMAKKPADRFRDPAALLDELNAALRDGIEQGWATAGPNQSLAEILQTANERAAVTSRLDELMKTTALATPRRLSFARIAAAIAACVLVGLLVGALLRPAPLLANAEEGPRRSSDVWGQLYQAKLVDTEQGWQAVAKNFPDADSYALNLARQGLLYYYLTRTQDYDKALHVARQLTNAAEREFQSFGQAGMVVAYVHMDDDEQAMYTNQRLDAANRDALEQRSPRMAQLLNESLDTLADRAL